MDIEMRMIKELQKCLDEVKKCDVEIAKNDWDIDVWKQRRRLWSDKYCTWANFAERVTGKVIESGGWKVRFKEG